MNILDHRIVASIQQISSGQERGSNERIAKVVKEVLVEEECEDVIVEEGETWS